MRRPLHVALHWANSFLIIAVLASNGDPLSSQAFGVVGLIWASVALGLGLNGRPGPALQGALRHFHPWSHRALYLVVAIAALSALQVPWFADLPTRQILLGLIAAGAIHGVFHLWRHTTLGDNAMNTILPKFMHGIL